MYQSHNDKNANESSYGLITNEKNSAKISERSGAEHVENSAGAKQKDFVGNTPRVQRLAAFQRMVDASSKVQRTAQLMSLQTNSDVVQRAINVVNSDHREANARASYVEAQVDGDTLPVGSNAPSVYPAGWDEIAEKYEMGNVYRMHLWNGRLGGPGNQTWNLTPGVEEANTSMGREEVKAQTEVDNDNTVSLDTTVTYGHTVDNTKPEYFYPSHITFNWLSQDDNGDTVTEGSWDEDIPLPTVEDADWDPNDPDNLGLDDD